MPYLRCDECGAKALPIATRCPACEAPFEARGPGTSPTRLRACPGCDSLVPRDAERCRWCDEELGGRLSPRTRSGIAAGFVLLLAGGWAFADSRTPDVVTLSAPVSEVVSSQGMTPSPPPASLPPAAGADETDPGQAPVEASAAEAPAQAPASAPAQARASAPAQARAPTPAPVSAPASAQPEPARTTPAAPAPAPQVSAPSTEGGWVQAVARTFVNVRTAPGSDSEVQGVVPENAVVLLGDARGAWRQVRAGSVAGWAWEPLFRVGTGGP